MFNINISFTIIFNIKIQLSTYEMCTLNSFYLQNFLHTPYYTVHGPGSHQHGLQSQIRHWENCWLEIISPELMFEFLISLTSISQCQSKGQLLFIVTGNNSFLLCPRHLAQVGCMKVSQLKSSVQKLFRKLFRSIKLSSHLHKSMHVVLA